MNLAQVDHMRIVGVIGTFDLLHPGHLTLLRHATRVAERAMIVVWVNSDFLTQGRGKTPIMTEQDRIDVMASLRDVNLVLPYDGNYRTEVAPWRPTTLVVGDDWLPISRYADILGVTSAELPHVEFVPRTVHSSTSLRHRARAGARP